MAIRPGRDKVPKPFLLDCETIYADDYSEVRIVELAVQPYIPGQSMDSMEPLRRVVNPLDDDTDEIPAQELLSADFFPAAWNKVLQAIHAWTDPKTEVPLIVAHDAPVVAKFLRAEFNWHDMPCPENLLVCCSLAFAGKIWLRRSLGDDIWPEKSTKLADLAIDANVPKKSVDTALSPHQRVKLLSAVLDYMNSYSLGNINVGIMYSFSKPLASLQGHFPIADYVLYTVGMVHKSGDALITAFSALEERHEASRSLLESKMSVSRIYAAIDPYTGEMNKKKIPSRLLRSIGRLFLDMLSKLRLWKLRPAQRCGRIYSPALSYSKFWHYARPSNSLLLYLESQLIEHGFIQKSLRVQLKEVTTVVRDWKLCDSEISKIVETIDLTLKKDVNTDLNPEEAKNLVDALSKLPRIKKAKLTNLTRKVWEGWNINFDDVEFTTSSSGDRQRIRNRTKSNVYLARMKLRDEIDNSISGDTIEVAVEQFRLKSMQEKETLEFEHQFEHQVFLLKHVQHPCIVRTFGGYWPERVEHHVIEPFIVMERMTHNLREAQEEELLDSFELKLRVLIDIAAGIDNLHDRRINHHDINPENVLMRVIEREFVGRAKVALKIDLLTTSSEKPSNTAGASAYIAPEEFNDSSSKACATARDIWCYGVLMCEVLIPDFLTNLGNEDPERLQVLAMSGRLPKLVVQIAKNFAIDQILVQFAVSCLSYDPKLRPRAKEVSKLLKKGTSTPLPAQISQRIKDVPSKLENVGSSYDSDFLESLLCNQSWKYKANQVIVFLQSCDEVDIFPEQARQLLNALSRSGIPDDIKLELSEKARKIWQGWQVNFDDIEYVRKRNGDRKRIGGGAFGQVYLGRMKLRDENGVAIAGEPMEVAVKQFVVRCSRSEAEFPTFMREVFLQKRAQHPCIVRTHGGHWPDPEEDEDEIEACIVMERMTYNLVHLQEKQLLNCTESKRRILGDVAVGIAHLHAIGIVHRDIKPENVLVNAEGDVIIGRAKVCDFGVSRKVEESDFMTDSMQKNTRPTGTSLYMPPEAFSRSAQDATKPARDIWSFGVLMCEVLDPTFLENLEYDHPEEADVITRSGQFARKVAESAGKMTCDEELKQLAVSCLSLDPTLRPRIADVREKLAYRAMG